MSTVIELAARRPANLPAPRHRRPVHPSEVAEFADPAPMFANHDHAMHAPSCPACDPVEYSEQDARHRGDC